MLFYTIRIVLINSYTVKRVERIKLIVVFLLIVDIVINFNSEKNNQISSNARVAVKCLVHFGDPCNIFASCWNNIVEGNVTFLQCINEKMEYSNLN